MLTQLSWQQRAWSPVPGDRQFFSRPGAGDEKQAPFPLDIEIV
jgi:hypothetical protein